jgi:hypothetical protein
MFKQQQEKFYQSVFYRSLCDKIIETSGLSVSNFKECENLAREMEGKGYTISSHTLARFFGILPFRKTYPATLDILVNYVGYSSFSHYIEQETQFIERGLNAPGKLFDFGAYSMISLELAIETNDKKSIQELLASVDMNHPGKVQVTQLLGRMVRASKNKRELLQTLISFENGRRLFYESYVDEDDANGYFSNALESYYLQHATTINTKLFGHCYLISKGIYSNKSFNHLLVEFEQFPKDENSDQLHFHELSRLIETQILIDGIAKKIDKTYSIYLDKLLSYENEFDNHSFAWLLARPLKAFAFNGLLRKILQTKQFSEAILRCYRQSKVESTAELILQYVVHANFKNSDELYFHPPLRLQSVTHQNENNARVILESSTSYIFAEEKEKVLLKKNIHTFAKQTGQTWVFDLLE